MNVLETVKEMGPDALKALTEGVDDDETEDEKRENARLIHHSEIVRDLVFKFRADSAGNTELGDDFFLPRRFLGNLDMLIETDVATGRTSAVLTQQEKNAIEQACVQKVSLFIKGSAGNGKTTGKFGVHVRCLLFAFWWLKICMFLLASAFRDCQV